MKIGDTCPAPKCTALVTGVGSENYVDGTTPGRLLRSYCEKGHRVETWTPDEGDSIPALEGRDSVTQHG